MECNEQNNPHMRKLSHGVTVKKAGKNLKPVVT